MAGIGLQATIGANADPFRREIAAVQAMSARAGAQIQRNMEGGHGGHLKTGAMRELIVSLREVVSGNFSRLPGSLSILLQQLGVLDKLTGSTANSAKILADAWALQAEKAHLAEVAAIRKAGASAMAFEADAAETEATLNQAVADETAAKAAIQNARATEEKAIASAEAAAASKVSAGMSFASVALPAAIVAAIALTIYETYWGMKKALEGIKWPTPKLDYIPKMLTAAGHQVQVQRDLNKEIAKTIDLYRSAASSAQRVADATKEHFSHLRKMNDFEKDPTKKAQKELEINKQERVVEISNKKIEQANLVTESQAKAKQAAGIKVKSAAEDEQTQKALDAKAEAGQAYLDRLKLQGEGWSVENAKQKLAIEFGGPPEQREARKKAIEDSMDLNYDQAYAAIANRDKYKDKALAHEETRKTKEDLEKQSAEAAKKATQIGLELPDLEKKNRQKAADEAEEGAAELRSKQKVLHGSVNSLQQIGGFTGQAGFSNQLRILSNSEKHLAELVKIQSRAYQIAERGRGNSRRGVKY